MLSFSLSYYWKNSLVANSTIFNSVFFKLINSNINSYENLKMKEKP